MFCDHVQTRRAIPEFTAEEQLCGLVKAMTLPPDDCEIFAVSEAAKHVTLKRGSPVSCVDILLQCCEANWRFSNTVTSCAVSLCQVDAINNTESGSFRTLWLKKLQSLFLRKYVNIPLVLFGMLLECC